VQGLTDATNAFNDLPPAAQSTAAAFLAITAVTGGALWFGSKVINGVADTKLALQQLGIQAQVTRGALTGIGAGLNFAAILGGIYAVDKAMDKVFGDNQVDSSNLTRNLQALGDGRVVDNLGEIGDDLSRVNRSALEFSDTVFGFLPGDTTFGVAKENIDQIDEALAQMVEGGSADQAALIMAEISKQADAAGVSTAETTKWFKQYQLALENTAPAAEEATTTTAKFGVAARQAANQARELKGALAENRQAARDTAKQFVGLGDSLSDGKVSLDDWIKSLQDQADALRNFRLNAEKAAKKGLDDGLIASLREAGPEGALRMRQLSNATETEIDKANRAWRRGQAEVRRYTNEVGGVPDSKVTRLTAVVDPALAAVQRIKQALSEIPREVRTRYYVTQVNAANVQGGGGRDGDPTTPYAYGGYTGAGGKYEPAGIVHRGELVLPQEVVRRDWGMLKARYGGLPGFADGGMPGGTDGRSVKALQASLDKLTKALEKQSAVQDKLLAQRSELRSGIATGLRSDIFATPSSPWSSQGSPIGGLRTDIRNARHFDELVKKLARKGVDGAALQEIIASGDVQRAEMMANLSRSTLGTYERLYNRRDRVIGQAGGTASRALGITQQIGRVTDRMDQMQAEIKGLRQDIRHKQQADHKSRQQAADRSAAGVNGAAASGHRGGSKGP
jgi:hypothetical protein